ncbi:MAG TPA: hypothetical protein VF198_11605 [Vicinamibacterales bacterium]
MKTHFLFASVAAVALAAAPIAAQSPQTPSPQSPTTQSPTGSQYGQEQTTTITGCVKAGTDGRSFTLEPDKSASESATPGESSSAQRSSGMSGDSKTWSLMASSGDVDLSKYVGQKVQITGRADSSAQSGASSSTSSAAGAHPRFHVQSVRVLSQTCS